MANDCYYEMKIYGSDAAIDEFADLLSWRYGHANDGLGRVSSADVYDCGIGWAQISGNCAWSIYSAMIDRKGRNLLGEAKRLGLMIEAYSQEPGIGFEEHYIIDKGEMLVEDATDYQEYYVEEMDVQERKELAADLGISVEELFDGMNENGDYTIGGYEDFADFTALDALAEKAGEEGKQEMDEFRYCFQIDKMTLFEVDFHTLGSNENPYFATSANHFIRSKRDFDRSGQAQDALLPKGSPARQFWEKWDHKHLLNLTPAEYALIRGDIEGLMERYNYIEDVRGSFKGTRLPGISFSQQVELSKLTPKPLLSLDTVARGAARAVEKDAGNKSAEAPSEGKDEHTPGLADMAHDASLASHAAEAKGPVAPSREER